MSIFRACYEADQRQTLNHEKIVYVPLMQKDAENTFGIKGAAT